MMIYKDFKFFIIFFFCVFCLKGQNTLYGVIQDSLSNKLIENAQFFNQEGALLTSTDSLGLYTYTTELDSIDVYIMKEGYEILSHNIYFNDNKVIELNVKLVMLDKELSVIELSDRKNIFESNYLEDVSNNSIYSGKKTEIIQSSEKIGNASNTARNMYNQTVSLNIYQTDDAGLQLNIGGRGLDPRRTSNFNVRQNNYDISADPLGYPESYYVPPFESLKNIEVIRGAASLQYGTQFGGLMNFNIKKPNRNKKIELLTRNTFGSNNLYTNFTSLSGSVKKYGYYFFYNRKRGDGFRKNSDFYSDNLYAFLSYKPIDKIKLSFEFTYLDYLAHQAGGLTDVMFDNDIFQSNRERNWFSVKWLLYNFQLSYDFSSKTNFSVNSFLLDANRSAVGFRTNRVDQIDSYTERDLIKSDFDNIGVETKLLHNYSLLNKQTVLLIGAKFYSGNTLIEQGPGSNGVDSDFEFQFADYPNYENQSSYSNPNLNYALFSEHIIYLNNRMSITPGFRFEYIQTSSDGYYRDINTDAAGNVILNDLIQTDDVRERDFFLYGVGYSFNLIDWSEFYANYSQNYRAVTFSDINIVSPSFIIKPEIKDENGYTFDFGFRGNYKDLIFYDISAFSLFYNDRIGFVQREFTDGSVKNEKGNVGDANIYGQECLLNFNLQKILSLSDEYKMNYFINCSFIQSKYIESQENGVEGNYVEFVPKLNLKTGFQFGFKRFKSNIQYTFISQQYTDATNSVNGDLSGVIGLIPEYDILDVSLSYFFNNFKFELGVNNMLDNYYFTNRATGYPGPGIIPSPSRNIYMSLELKM